MKNRITTKDEERAALEKIKGIIEDLGEGSYLSAAFEGCFETAEDNIRNDFCNSPAERISALTGMLTEAEAEIAGLRVANGNLKKKLAAIEAWQPWINPDEYPVDKYMRLKNSVKAAGQYVMSDDEAKNLIRKEFGFAPECVTIIRTAPLYKKNYQGRIKEDGAREADPLYSSSDWNYIRFTCGGYTWEMQDGELVNVTM